MRIWGASKKNKLIHVAHVVNFGEQKGLLRRYLLNFARTSMYVYTLKEQKIKEGCN